LNEEVQTNVEIVALPVKDGSTAPSSVSAARTDDKGGGVAALPA